jgi:NADH-quinone oxidoreductase subunit A
MLRSYAPILILMALSIGQALGMVALSHALTPLRPTPAKSSPYESGITPLGSTRERFSVKFYLVAILFIVFDLETVFLIPWAVMMRELGWGGFVAASIFVTVLTVGLIYEWKKGGLRWD